MNKAIKTLATCILAAFVLAGCAGNNANNPSAAPRERNAVESTQLQFTEPQAADTIITLDTSLGIIKAVLYPQYTPQAVENFVDLAQQGYYNGVSFHRVVKDFVIQSGDDTATGTGGTTIWDGSPYSVEVSDKLYHFSGALGVARVGGDINSCRSQFYIVQAAQNSVDKATQQALTDAGFSESVVSTYAAAGGTPQLDGNYTVFGQVIEGMDIVDAIGNVKTNHDKPVDDVIINTITVSTY